MKGCSSMSIDDGLLRKRLRIDANVQMAVGIDLDHQYAEHLFLGIDEEVSAESPAPAVAADGAERRALAQVGEDAESQAETVTREIGPDGLVADVIGGHQLDGLAAHQAG